MSCSRATDMDRSKLKYRPNVGLMILNPAGEVFVGQRTDRYTDAWQMPQGGIDAGEDPLPAALREMEEETGITADKVTLVAESETWLPYELPDDLIPKLWGGKYRGQEQKWFLFQFTGTNADINIQTKDQEFSDWKWLAPAALLDSIVPFKRSVYSAVLQEFEAHL
ncbi:MAG: RNA pyrophosphohydrolase [Pseudomonadota bacterium]